MRGRGRKIKEKFVVTKRSTQRPRYRRRDNIKTDFTKISFDFI